jgi:hypothetical protein
VTKREGKHQGRDKQPGARGLQQQRCLFTARLSVPARLGGFHQKDHHPATSFRKAITIATRNKTQTNQKARYIRVRSLRRDDAKRQPRRSFPTQKGFAFGLFGEQLDNLTHNARTGEAYRAVKALNPLGGPSSQLSSSFFPCAIALVSMGAPPSKISSP